MEAACGALTYQYPPPRVSIFFNILLGYSRIRSSPLLSLRPKLKDSNPRSRNKVSFGGPPTVQEAANENEIYYLYTE